MRFVPLSWARLAVAFGTVACGSSTAAGGDNVVAGTFVGTWSCILAVTETAFTVAVVENSDGSITVTPTGAAVPLCTAKYTVSGGTATVESGQSCTTGGSTVAVSGGTATVSGSTLTGNLTVGVAGVSETLSYTCTKQP
ncbi:MAG: hypothetical protein ABSF69_02685 [Polyangiaceae bacterium]|jgi:hypothetical protein